MHTPAEIGFWRGPQILKLNLLLKNNLAGAWWLRCLELWVLHADGRGRLPKAYDAVALAAAAEYPGSPKVFISALKQAGLVEVTRGKPLALSDWKNTPAGRYGELREADRIRKRKARADKGGGDERGEEPRPSDVPRTSSGNPDSKEERTSAGRPPEPPPEGGDLGITRWDWLRSRAERPRAAPTCIRLLQGMSADDWALVQWVYSDARREGAIRGKKMRALSLQTDQFLQKQSWLEFLRDYQAAQKRAEKKAAQAAAAANGTAPTAPSAPDPAAFIRALLADPDVPEPEKERQKAAWLKTNAGQTPPWELQ